MTQKNNLESRVTTKNRVAVTNSSKRSEEKDSLNSAPAGEQRQKPKHTLAYTVCIGTLAAVTTPIWISAAWLGYQGMRGVRWAFKNPNASLVLVGAGALMLYANQRGCITAQTVLNYATGRDEQTLSEPATSTGTEPARQGLENRLLPQEKPRYDSAQQTAPGAKPNNYSMAQASIPQAQPPSSIQPVDQSWSAESAILRSSQQLLQKSIKIYAQPITLADLYFYFVQPGDTKETIARKFGTYANEVCQIERELSQIEVPEGLIPGERKVLPRAACTRTTKELYVSVPDLENIRLERHQSIESVFEKHAPVIIALNQKLGTYHDQSVGRRIVWYPKQ